MAARGAFIALLLAAAALASSLAALGAAAGAHEPQTRIGIDADPSGNTATTLGDIDQCLEISEGDTQAVDIFVQDVENLLAWEAVLTFEPTVVEVVDVDVDLFMGANPGSSVQSVSGDVPDSDGRFQVGAFDAADPPAPDSGSGVLARITLRGVGPGVSELRLPLSDLDGDGRPDEGPLLRDVDVNDIGDVDGDTFFDGPIDGARIAVDASCADEPGPAGGEEASAAQGGDREEDGGIGVAAVVAVVVGFIASVALGVLAAAWAIRRFSRTQG